MSDSEQDPSQQALKPRTSTRSVVVHFTGNTDMDYTRIRREHLEAGLPEIGYHFVIDAEGKLLMGRHQSKVGAHHPEYDRDSVGVCMVGEKSTMTEAQHLALILLLDKLRVDYPEVESVKYITRVPNE